MCKKERLFNPLKAGSFDPISPSRGGGGGGIGYVLRPRRNKLN